MVKRHLVESVPYPQNRCAFSVVEYQLDGSFRRWSGVVEMRLTNELCWSGGRRASLLLPVPASRVAKAGRATDPPQKYTQNKRERRRVGNRAQFHVWHCVFRPGEEPFHLRRKSK